MSTRLRFVSCAILVVMLAFGTSWGATSSIRGKVTDVATGDPLPGVTIQLKGTPLGAATDLNGNYMISNVPAGSYTLEASYVGYKRVAIEIRLKEDESLGEDVKMEAVGVTAKEVVITAQASGQNAAINQQLSSNNVVNVVSSARIQELPDANAAESLGRLPGVSLVRSGGEATQVVIRGLEPKYNMTTIDGVEIPATDVGDRGTDLSMISSYLLQGIEVYKTVTPDMDAAVLGGTVNFDIKEAKASPTGRPSFFVLAQGGYNNLQDLYNSYKFVGSAEDRFFDERFGIFAQGIIEKANRTSDGLSVGYYIPNKTEPQITAINNVQPSFDLRERLRYDGTLVMDYRLPNGRISFMNLLSQGKTNTEGFDQQYAVTGNNIYYHTSYSPNTLNVITNLLDFRQTLFSINMDARLSHSYTENISPNNWSIGFNQAGVPLASLPYGYSPDMVAKYANGLTNLDTMFIDADNTSSSFSKQRDITGAIDFERDFTFSDLVSARLKIGGEYRYTARYYNYDDGGGYLLGSIAIPVRKLIAQAFPWMTKPPYSRDPNALDEFPITIFWDPNFSFGKFLGGQYAMNCGTNVGLLSQVINISKTYGDTLSASTSGGSNPYVPDVYGSLAHNYSGVENRSAEYLMATINIGPQITIIPGVRYQGLQTSYKANRFYNASAANPYPGGLPHTDTTITEYHGFWLPDVSLKYSPFTWLSVRAAYTNTIAYPDFNAIIPIIDVFSASANWNNTALKPAHSQNFDLHVSVYDNSIGLLAVGPFLKRIDDLIFPQSTYITDPSQYPGLPSYTKGFAVSTYMNNPNRVDLWGVESEWQTHFWYLPHPFNGLVLNFNYTHIFSQAKYPYTITSNSGYPYFKPIYIDTTYTDRLIDQPNDIVNLSLGYDYKNFSIVCSMIYQSQIYNGTNFYNSLRSDKVRYLRWDIAAKQGLPWSGVEVFLDLNNINSENDTYTMRGSGFPNSSSDYGMTADLGLRWRL